MPKRKSEFLGNVFLILLIIVFVFFIHSIFIAGPLRAYEKEDTLYLETFVENTEYESARFLDRYQNEDGLYYIVLVDEKKKAEIAVFKNDLSEIETFPYISRDELARKLKVDAKHVQYAYFDQQLVFEVREDGTTRYYDADNLQPLKEERD